MIATRSTIKQAEQEWFNYNDYLREIATLRQGIMHPYDAFPDENIGGGSNSVRDISDPTADVATKLYLDDEIKYWEDKLKPIEQVYNMLPDNYKKMARLRYFSRNNRLTWEGVAFRVGISERQARRWRDEVMQATIEIL